MIRRGKRIERRRMGKRKRMRTGWRMMRRRRMGVEGRKMRSV